MAIHTSTPEQSSLLGEASGHLAHCNNRFGLSRRVLGGYNQCGTTPLTAAGGALGRNCLLLYFHCNCSVVLEVIVSQRNQVVLSSQLIAKPHQDVRQQQPPLLPRRNNRAATVSGRVS